jgi:hypothetical protein
MKNFQKLKKFKNGLHSIKNEMKKSNCDKCCLHFASGEAGMTLKAQVGYCGSSSTYDKFDSIFTDKKEFYRTIQMFLNSNKEEYFKYVEKLYKKESKEDLTIIEDKIKELQDNMKEIEDFEKEL